jgi:hypothetical protein
MGRLVEIALGGVWVYHGTPFSMHGDAVEYIVGLRDTESRGTDINRQLSQTWWTMWLLYFTGRIADNWNRFFLQHQVTLFHYDILSPSILE